MISKKITYIIYFLIYISILDKYNNCYRIINEIQSLNEKLQRHDIPTKKVSLMKQSEKIEIFKNRLKIIYNSISKKIDSNKIKDILMDNKKINSGNDGINKLMEENDSLSVSYKVSSQLTKQAKTNLEELSDQDKNLLSVNDKLETILSKIPVIGKIIGTIGYYKFREQVVLGFVTGICIYILLSVIFN